MASSAVPQSSGTVPHTPRSPCEPSLSASASPWPSPDLSQGTRHAFFAVPLEGVAARKVVATAVAEGDLVWARGFVPVIKCRLCPDTDFSNWDAFTRHAKAAEAHPYKISFCDSCGDYFARSDSLKRHSKKRRGECLEISPETAKEKRRPTERAHKDFVEYEAQCLKTGEQLKTPFAGIIRTMYPGPRRGGAGSRVACKHRSRGFVFFSLIQYILLLLLLLLLLLSCSALLAFASLIYTGSYLDPKVALNTELVPVSRLRTMIYLHSWACFANCHGSLPPRTRGREKEARTINRSDNG